MLQAGVLKPVHQATPWINGFVLVEGKDNLGKLKLRICLDPTNPNKAIVCEPYHFKTPEDIGHLLEACRNLHNYSVWLQQSFWHQQLDEASSLMTTFHNKLGRFHYTAIPFGATVASYVFQHKLDECFGKIKQVINTTDYIMIVGYKPDHSDQDQAFPTCYKWPRSVMWSTTMKSFNTSKVRWHSLVKHIPQVVAGQVKIKCQL